MSEVFFAQFIKVTLCVPFDFVPFKQVLLDFNLCPAEETKPDIYRIGKKIYIVVQCRP